MRAQIFLPIERLLSIPPDLAVLHAEVTDQEAILTIASTSAASTCPCCSQCSQRIHSRYQRTIADLPVAGLAVRLVFQARKFFCQTPDCARRIFTERVPALVAPSARKTVRLFTLLQTIALHAGGEVGTRIMQAMGLRVSPDTLLALVHRLPLAASPPPRVVGIDEWAWRKRFSYGTILVDLERQRVLDLLPNRRPETVITWLQAHPSIEIITRDRSGGYSEAIRQGAPTAQPVADRWHLAHNLAEALERVFVSKRGLLKAAVADTNATAPPHAEPPAPEYSANLARDGRPSNAPWIQREATIRQQRHAQYLELYERIHDLRTKKADIADIARMVGASRRTVYRYLAMTSPPAWQQPAPRRTPLSPYHAYIRTRWEEGCHNVRQLWREICEQGYAGSEAAVHAFARRQLTRPGAPPPISPGAGGLSNGRTPSAGHVAHLFLQEPADLTHNEQTYLAQLCVQDQGCAMAYGLSQEFMRMLRQRDGVLFDAWLAHAKGSAIEPLVRFAHGLEKDGSAVRVGLTLPWNNGQVEGHVHRLKLLKRQSYGRATLALLRQRVVYHD